MENIAETVHQLCTILGREKLPTTRTVRNLLAKLE